MIRSRRRFLGQAAGAVVASAGLPGALAARPNTPDVPTVGSLADLRERLASLQDADEAYWRLVRDQFPIRDDLVLMNAANLCPSPRPVQARLFELTRDVDADASFQNRAKFSELAETSRGALARMMGADADEVAIVRNTSSANATVVNGLELGPGDEVLLWDQNHPTNAVAWDVGASRHGYTVRRISTPPAPVDADTLLAPFADALGPRTRVLAFSHVSNSSGVGLPAARLCALARERGTFTLVDGAQTFGAIRVDLHEMGCDAYSGSAHKWPVGPKEAGLLYVRRDRQAELWPTHVGVGWEGAERNGARKYEVLGQRDDAAVAAVATAVTFQELIGADRWEARVRGLASALRDALRERIPDIRFHTPEEPALSAGVLVFALPGVEGHGNLHESLYRDHGVAGAAMGGAHDGLRLCPHVYNTMDQVQHAADAVAGVA